MAGSGGDEDQDDAATARILAAASFAFTVILLGIPLWLKTTEVYRASIPYSGIAGLQELAIDVSTGAKLELVAPSLPAAERFVETLRPELPAGLQLIGRQYTEAEQKAMTSSADVWTADDALNAEPRDTPRLFVLPERLADSAPASVLLGRHSDVFVTSAAAVGEEVGRLAGLLRTAVLGESGASSAGRRVRSSPGYQLLISVVVPDPASTRVTWDPAVEVRRYLQPLLDSLRPLTNLTVQSQYLYHASLGVQPQQDAASGEFYLSEQQLTMVITPLEARLGSFVSSHPTLHFIVYVPPAKSRPLRIRPPGGADAFVSPRWGGVQIYNPPADGSATVSLDGGRVMSLLVTQLRQLLGVPDLPSGDWLTARPPGPAGLRGWELRALRRLRTLENVENARKNLASLAAMLEQISNIVINDEVGGAVEEGVAAAEEAAERLAAGDEQAAYLSSRRALAASEKAVYDPSMLALLYFPDDQKYAVYIPLFLPISIPVLMSLKTMWVWLRDRRAKVKTE